MFYECAIFIKVYFMYVVLCRPQIIRHSNTCSTYVIEVRLSMLSVCPPLYTPSLVVVQVGVSGFINYVNTSGLNVNTPTLHVSISRHSTCQYPNSPDTPRVDTPTLHGPKMAAGPRTARGLTAKDAWRVLQLAPPYIRLHTFAGPPFTHRHCPRCCDVYLTV